MDPQQAVSFGGGRLYRSPLQSSPEPFLGRPFVCCGISSRGIGSRFPTGLRISASSHSRTSWSADYIQIQRRHKQTLPATPEESQLPQNMRLSHQKIEPAAPGFVLRCLLSQALGRSNQIIRTQRRDQLSHLDLEQDLRLLIPSKAPLLVDVGANKGQTIEIFQRIFVSPVIHAFEPNKRLVEQTLSSKYGRNTNIVLNAAALGSESGSLTLNQNETDELSSFLEMQVDEQNPFKNQAVSTQVTVPVLTLDQYVAEKKLEQIDLLKIDTQGFDLQVLKGASEKLASGQIKFVMMEVNFVPMYDGQPSFGDVDLFLREHGYALVDMYEKIYQNNRLAWCTGVYQSEKTPI